MLINEVTLTETFENLLPGDDEKKKHYAEEIFAMLTAAYKNKGGLIGGGFESPEDMVNKIPFWKIFRRGSHILTVVMYKDKQGRKIVAAATDGTVAGKRKLGEIMKADVLRGRAFAEISGNILTFYNRLMGDGALDAATVPMDRVQDFFAHNNVEIKPINDFEYERNINNSGWKTKRMIGTLGKSLY